MVWESANLVGYKPITTIWQDLTIAEAVSKASVRETVEEFFDNWKTNTHYLTELVMAINHKAWYWNNYNEDIMQFYSNLYYEFDEKAIKYLEENGTEDDLNYYFRTLD